jgi:hypothetical protein
MLGARQLDAEKIMRKQIAAILILATAFGTASLLAFGSALAAPADGVDPKLSPWFEGLTQPGTGAGCCSIADCRVAEVRHDAEGYQVKVDGRWGLSAAFWLRVPPERILDRTDNPTGQAVLCFTPSAGILCFVRPPDS